ncbi:Kinesin-like protein KIF20A [Merluccius polli]|uniref:Kinesin-like protein KIF20A n=1 Tax=Merluccius polli TaxID=89951 RepID=A0AA47MR74_MERPO|nr:Kinesin-like protein KIF20A [Merluccius polli]
MGSRSTENSECMFALWVAFFEIYNESVYDLLQATLCSKSKKRTALRVCEDRAGNTYVRGETHLECIIE